jgi:hypothetical protein
LCSFPCLDLSAAVTSLIKLVGGFRRFLGGTVMPILIGVLGSRLLEFYSHYESISHPYSSLLLNAKLNCLGIINANPKRHDHLLVLRSKHLLLVVV